MVMACSTFDRSSKIPTIIIWEEGTISGIELRFSIFKASAN